MVVGVVVMDCYGLGSVVISGSWWFSVDSGGSRCLSVDLGSFQLVLMDLGGSRWFSVIIGRFWWLSVGLGGSRWISVVLDGSSSSSSLR